MRKISLSAVGSFVALTAIATWGCTTSRPVPEQRPTGQSEQPQTLKPEDGKQTEQAIAPKAFPEIPPADPDAAELPDGYRAEVVVRDLTYPTSIDFDDRGNLYFAEAGFSYGDPAGLARVIRVSNSGELTVVAEHLNGPVTDILCHAGKLYISHLGKISVRESDGSIRDLVTDIPVSHDHHNNQLTIGPDGKLYFGVGSVTNSGVVGLDNIYPFLWLLFYPDLHDVPPYDIEINDDSYTTPDALTVLARQGEFVSLGAAVEHLLSPSSPLLVKTSAFHPFGKTGTTIKGQVKSTSTILRVNLDGTGLEVYAWGLRNPFGVMWGPDGKLYATDNGYDERGSRPIANAPDVIWQVRQGGFYGFPDYVAGIPVTDERFKSERGPDPKMILKNPPPVEKPFMTIPPHAGVTKIDFAPKNDRFGHAGEMFIGEVGSGTPINAPGNVPSGFQVTRINLSTKQAEVFFRARPQALGPKGYEYVATPGPKRPVDVRFSPDGALYVADFGGLATFPAGAGPVGHPFPGSGAIWRITKSNMKPSGPPADISMSPKREVKEAVAREAKR
jgi:glucose/arabinose dehydrogenase